MISYGGSHYNQYKSNLEKKGEGIEHYEDKVNLGILFSSLGWEVSKPDQEKQLKIIKTWDGKTDTYIHKYDFYAIKKHANKLSTEIIIEVDGEEHYDNPIQIERDRLAERTLAFYEPQIYLIRMDKELLAKLFRSENHKLEVLKEIRESVLQKYQWDLSKVLFS